MSDQNNSLGSDPESTTKEIKIQIKSEPEIPTNEVKMEPPHEYHNYNDFGKQNNAVSEYYRNSYITDDNLMSQSGYNTNSETTNTVMGRTAGSPNAQEHDKLWNHFESIGDEDCAACKYCRKMFAYKSCIINLYAHLRQVHPAVFSEQFESLDEPEASTSKDYLSGDQLDTANECLENSKKPPLVWDHFYRVETFFALCKHCKRRLSYKTTTGNLNAHMRRVHRPILMEYLRKLENKSNDSDQNVSISNDDDGLYGSGSKYGIIWKYFDKIGTEYAICKECCKELSCKTTTGNLSTHLKRNHPSLYLQYKSISDRDPNEYTAITLGEDIPLPSLFVDYYDKTGRYTAICRYCSRKLPLSAKSSSLSRHLRLTHPKVYLEYKESKQKLYPDSQNDGSIVSDSGDDTEAEKEEERVKFDKWKKKGGLWAHYVQGRDRCATCKYCHKSISYKGTTGNLTGHLRRAHKPLYMNTGDKTTPNANSSTTTIIAAEVGNTEAGNNPTESTTNEETNEADVLQHSSKEGKSNDLDKVESRIIENASMVSGTEKTSYTDNIEEYNKMQMLPSTTTQVIESNESQHLTQGVKESHKEIESDVFLVDSNSQSGSADNTLPTNKSEDETAADNLSDNEDSTPLYTLKRRTLLWKYLERIGKKSYKCKVCDKIFPSRQEVPLIFHLKGRHPNLYKKYIKDQHHGLGSKFPTLEALDKIKHNKMAKEFIYQHYKKKDSITAQCKYCPVLCNWSLRRLILHLERFHQQFYLQYKSIKETGSYEEGDKAFLKLKKNAIPSIFNDRERFALNKSARSNMLEENQPVIHDENTPAFPIKSQNSIPENREECRACLKSFDVSVGLYDLFQPWFLPWNGMENTVAADMAKIAKIQILQSDSHSKYICYACCVQLRDACEFTAFVKRSDQLLRLRSMQSGEKWPEPIRLDTSVDATMMEVDIKQEMVSESEYDNEPFGVNNTAHPNPPIETVDIKLEPEEIVEPKLSDINGIMPDDHRPRVSESNCSDQSHRDNVATRSDSAPEANTSSYRGKIVRRDFCMFCEKLIVGYPKHITKMHGQESEMQPIMMCPKQSVERKKLVAVLRKKGNFMYKQKLAMSSERKRNQIEHVPCPECLGIYRKKLLLRHLKVSHGVTSENDPLMKAINVELDTTDVDKRLLEEVFPTMRKNRISLIAKTDKLIQAFGADYISQHSNSTYINVTSRKMRELAKVLIEMQKMEPSIKDFSDALQPINYDYLVKATKIISGYNEETAKFARPTLALNICTSYRQCCNLALEQAAKSTIDRTVKIEGFKEAIRLLHTSWRWDIYKKAMFNLTIRRMGDIDHITMVPLAKTVRLFMDYLVQKTQYLAPQLTSAEVPQEELYKELTEVIMCRVILFNRRRASEIQNIKLTTYDKVNNGRFYELYKPTSFTEQITMRKCKCVMITGRKDQIFPVFFTLETVKDISMLRSVRDKYFNNVNNPYLFGLPNTDTFMKGSKVMERHGKIYDAQNYKSMSSMRYRKHVAILSQIFYMSWADIHDLLNLQQLEQEHRLPDDVEQVARLCKILTAKEGLESKGKSIDEVHLNMDEDVENLQDGEVDAYEDSDNESYLTDPSDIMVREKKKRVVERWTPKQKDVVMSYFGENIKKCHPPKLHECNALKAKYPDLLHNKDWIKIKAFVQNTCRRKKNSRYYNT